MKASYKSYAIIAAVLMGCTTAHAQLQLDGRTAVNDSLTATWLFSVPEERFGQDFTATVDYHGLTGLTIDGAEVGETYTFKDVSGTKRWKIAGTDTQGNTVQQDIAFTFLPIVVIDCKVEKDNYNTGTVSVLLPDEDIVSPCKVKFRGGLTNSDQYFKRNYHLKFEDEYGNKRHKYTPHSCRHTFATLMKRVPGASKDKQELIGHASEEMLRYYQDVGLEDLRAITDAL